MPYISEHVVDGGPVSGRLFCLRWWLLRRQRKCAWMHAWGDYVSVSLCGSFSFEHVFVCLCVCVSVCLCVCVYVWESFDSGYVCVCVAVLYVFLWGSYKGTRINVCFWDCFVVLCVFVSSFGVCARTRVYVCSTSPAHELLATNPPHFSLSLMSDERPASH